MPLHRHGKTTLLNHISRRVLNIPPNIDVLLCEQGSLLNISYGDQYLWVNSKAYSRNIII